MSQEHDQQHQQLLAAAKAVQELRSGIVLSGRINNGKVELDQSTLDEIAKRFAGSNRSFVAVNAPFDPKPATV
jgi:hypothetical protein